MHEGRTVFSQVVDAGLQIVDAQRPRHPLEPLQRHVVAPDPGGEGLRPAPHQVPHPREAQHQQEAVHLHLAAPLALQAYPPLHPVHLPLRARLDLHPAPRAALLRRARWSTW